MQRRGGVRMSLSRMNWLETLLSVATHLVPIAVVFDPAIVSIKIEFLAPPMPRASTTQIYDTCFGQLEEPPRGRPDVLAAIALGSRNGVELAHEGFECGDVAPRTRAQGAREEDPE